MTFNRNNFHDRQILYELFWVLFNKAACIDIPASAFQIKTMHKATFKINILQLFNYPKLN